MKVVMIFDQTQAGLGGKENPMLPLGGKNMVIGSANMLDPYLKKNDMQIAACLYCGDGFFEANKEEVTKKMAAMCKKIGADAVLCGPAFNYEGYGEMCAHVGEFIEQHVGIPTVAAMSKECASTIEAFKDKVNIIDMPKKGGIGLTESLSAMCELAKMKVDGVDTTAFVEAHCY
ncbi:glycine/betaine/sarcosine/D-proline family reductase selenoprotein B [Vagococcus coleopterorum]|uniref:Glycine/betaine/sarcosine/D-proline family reductase selenoprotein B n=1 Tax=Vagococcus coleopterorum TaxID=2714946 RepID=A0A6G8AP54_9ENTE|nr:GrdB-related putative oxidoreductase [Vagococcus coleopterorum]QIL46749.1 glycine/betaine/sarcosine/D-proline family reductase selenoprotein B [Vagococcus coleopterorum]